MPLDASFIRAPYPVAAAPLVRSVVTRKTGR